MRKRTLAREYALQLLYQSEVNPPMDEAAFCAFWANLETADDEVKKFTKILVDGTHQYLEELDQLIQKYVDNWDMGRMAILDKNIIRMGIYELLFRDDIPPKVTINEAVNLAKKYSQDDAGKFVNGILDKINHSEPVRSVPHDSKPS